MVVYDDPAGKASGGTVAAPSFRRIASRSLAILGIPPEHSSVTSIAEIKAAPSESKESTNSAFVGKNFQTVLKEIKSLPPEQRARYDLIGIGTAFREEVTDDQRTKIYFR
jgi:hypothetical protein